MRQEPKKVHTTLKIYCTIALSDETVSSLHLGRVAEWLNVPPWKGGIRKFRIEGSNPSPSAKIQKGRKLRLPAFFHACGGVPAHPACRLQFFFKRFLTFSKNSGILRLLSKFDVSTKPITTAGMFAEHLWKGGRVVECTALERRHTEIPYRGFESLPFRQNSKGRKLRLSAFFAIGLRPRTPAPSEPESSRQTSFPNSHGTLFQKAHQDSSRRHAQPLLVGRQRHGRPQGRERLGRQARHLPQRWAAGHGHLQPHPPRQASRPTPQRRKNERGDRSARADGSRDGKRRRARGARPCARRS